MLLVNGKPILQHSIEAIRDGGIKEIVISVFFHKGVIEDFFGNGSKYGVTINYLEPAKVNGMAFSLYNSWNLIPDDHFLVVQGDIIFGPQLIRGLAEFQVRRRHAISIAVSKDMNAALTHRIVTVEGRNKIKRIRKGVRGRKDEYRCIGAWGFSSKIFIHLSSTDLSDSREWTVMTVLEELLIQKVNSYCFIYKDFWRSFHSPADLS